MRKLIAIAVLLGTSTTLAAQQPVAPPTRPAQRAGCRINT